jgi:hypothetical protein
LEAREAAAREAAELDPSLEETEAELQQQIVTI